MAKAAIHPPTEIPSYRYRSEVRIADCTFRGQQIHFLNFIGEPVPVAPAWCITDKELIVSLSPQTIKAHLARKPGGGSLADLPAVRQLFTAGAGPVSVSYADTRSVVETLYPLVQIGFGAAASELQREEVPIDVSILPSAAAILPHLSPSVGSTTMTSDGLLTVRRGTLPAQFELLPALAMWVGSSRWTTPAYSPGYRERASAGVVERLLMPTAAARVESMNNLKQIALAMFNYETTNRSFPAAYSTGKDGKRLLSCAVQILPYLEQGELYKQFHLDEPWDSPHNKKLIEKMPKIYAAPGSQAAKQFKTVYLVPHGEETIFPDGKATDIQKISDGTSNTILMVEASDSRAVIWTKPDDYEVDFKHPLAGLVGLRQNGFLAAFADGYVRFIKGSIAAKTLKALFTRAGGEVIDSKDY